LVPRPDDWLTALDIERQLTAEAGFSPVAATVAAQSDLARGVYEGRRFVKRGTDGRAR